MKIIAAFLSSSPKEEKTQFLRWLKTRFPQWGSFLLAFVRSAPNAFSFGPEKQKKKKVSIIKLNNNSKVI